MTILLVENTQYSYQCSWMESIMGEIYIHVYSDVCFLYIKGTEETTEDI